MRSSELSFFTADHPALDYVGRWGATLWQGRPARVLVSGGGNPLRFGFTGPSLSLDVRYEQMRFAPLVDVLIDGQWTLGVTLEVGLNGLALGLPLGPHQVEIWWRGIQSRLAPRWAHPLAVLGVQLAPGQTLHARPRRETGRLLVLGDSIAEGALSRGGTNDNQGEALFNDGRQSFVNLACRELNWDCWNHAFGGSGFFQPNSGGVPPTGQNYFWAAAGLPAQDPAFSAILIEAVNNDAAMTEAAFGQAYQELITQLRHDQPGVPIFCLGPFAGFATNKAPLVAEIARLNQCVWIDPQGWSFSTPAQKGDSDNQHPDVDGHYALARELIAALRAGL